AQTGKAWFAVVEARGQVELAEHSAKSFGESAARIQRRFERGVRSSLDVRLARTEHANAEAELAERREVLEHATRALQVLIGTYPDGEVAERTELPTLPERIPAGIPADVLSRRPDLVAAERRLAAADAALGAAKAARYPTISLTASGGTRSDDVADLLDGDFRVWSLAGNVLAPLVDQGRRQAQVDAADARRYEALATWAGAVLRALSEVETHLASATQLADAETHLDRASREAAAARDLSGDRYDRGLIDIVTLLEAQRRDVAARRGLLAMRHRRLANRIDLLLALGGGIPLQPTETEETDS
ncbi:MAG: efflux transporter outer membrane subunit, partial [Planctomycetes bacterium]|nr:efflux transporter outer membrane subunit [Planctomycetota bacterium]